MYILRSSSYCFIFFTCVISVQDFLKFNETRLKELPCQIFDPIPLGEGAGVGWMKDGTDSMAMPEGSSLYDLIDTGIKHTHAAVGVLVRLRKELSHVKDIPVLIAIDQVRLLSQLPLLCNVQEIYFQNSNFLTLCCCFSPVQ